MDARARILIVDDHEIVRLGLKILFDRQPDLTVVDEAKNSSEALEKLLQHCPDVVVVDLKLAKESGCAVIEKIKAQSPQTRVLGLTAYADDDLLADAIVAGADGCVLKELNSDRLLAVLRAVARGETAVDARVLEKVARRARRQSSDDPFGMLTWQERRILAQLAEGRSNREIAAMFNLAEKTIRNYVSQILGKLNLASRTQAAAYAIRHNLKPGTR